MASIGKARKRLAEVPDRIERIHQAAFFTTVQTLLQVEQNVRYLREKSLTKAHAEFKDADHYTSELDKRVELEAEARLRSLLQAYGTPADLEFHGEESLKDKALDLSNTNKVVVLVDMIDGTDLLARELGNWCSAMIFYVPASREILAAYVGMSYGDYYRIYAANQTESGKAEATVIQIPIVLRNGGRDVDQSAMVELPLTPDSPGRSDVSARDASICFYGQKRDRLMSVLNGTGFPSDKTLEGATKLRIYTLAGNPMMAKVADGRVSAVCETIGQHPHDVAPGAFIAEAAGCFVSDLQGKPLGIIDSLIRPASDEGKLTYLISSGPTLHRELLPLLARR